MGESLIRRRNLLFPDVDLDFTTPDPDVKVYDNFAMYDSYWYSVWAPQSNLPPYFLMTQEGNIYFPMFHGSMGSHAGTGYGSIIYKHQSFYAGNYTSISFTCGVAVDCGYLNRNFYIAFIPESLILSELATGHTLTEWENATDLNWNNYGSYTNTYQINHLMDNSAVKKLAFSNNATLANNLGTPQLVLNTKITVPISQFSLVSNTKYYVGLYGIYYNAAGSTSPDISVGFKSLKLNKY